MTVQNSISFAWEMLLADSVIVAEMFFFIFNKDPVISNPLYFDLFSLLLALQIEGFNCTDIYEDMIDHLSYAQLKQL